MTSKKNGPAPAGTGSTVRTHELEVSIPRKRTAVKRRLLSVTRAEALEIGRRYAPKFDFPLLSKCLKPHEYGIEPIEPIRSKIFSESPVRDFRVLSNQFTVRTSDELKTRLQIAKRAYGEDCTNQEFILTAILHECERIEAKRKEAEYGVTV